MAAYTPPPSPGDLRSPRNRALEIGTERAGFGDQMPYDTQAGVPMVPGMPTGIARDIGPQLSYVGGAINPAAPFALKK